MRRGVAWAEMDIAMYVVTLYKANESDQSTCQTGYTQSMLQAWAAGAVCITSSHQSNAAGTAQWNGYLAYMYGETVQNEMVERADGDWVS